jgi:hypothetical protein
MSGHTPWSVVKATKWRVVDTKARWRWVKRNEDKPHRCPECHAVATWDKHIYGPRTKLKCPARCWVIWRVGNRMTRENEKYLKRHAERTHG